MDNRLSRNYSNKYKNIEKKTDYLVSFLSGIVDTFSLKEYRNTIPAEFGLSSWHTFQTQADVSYFPQFKFIYHNRIFHRSNRSNGIAK